MNKYYFITIAENGMGEIQLSVITIFCFYKCIF